MLHGGFPRSPRPSLLGVGAELGERPELRLFPCRSRVLVASRDLDRLLSMLMLESSVFSLRASSRSNCSHT
jgi:hypothetical protein